MLDDRFVTRLDVHTLSNAEWASCSGGYRMTPDAWCHRTCTIPRTVWPLCRWMSWGISLWSLECSAATTHFITSLRQDFLDSKQMEESNASACCCANTVFPETTRETMSSSISSSLNTLVSRGDADHASLGGRVAAGPALKWLTRHFAEERQLKKSWLQSRESAFFLKYMRAAGRYRSHDTELWLMRNVAFPEPFHPCKVWMYRDRGARHKDNAENHFLFFSFQVSTISASEVVSLSAFASRKQMRRYDNISSPDGGWMPRAVLLALPPRTDADACRVLPLPTV